jgi:hypothetical protein
MPAWFGGSTLNPDELIPRDQQWKLQWTRVIRWYQRTSDIARKSIHSEPSVYDLDVVIAFLQNCYHLRDWIEACRPELKEKTKNLFSRSFEMRACRDVCNGFKHKNHKTPSQDADFNLYREYDPFAADANPSLNAIKYRIAFSDGDGIRKYDLFEFTESCYRTWDNFLAQEML